VANTYRVAHPIPDPAPLVSLIVPTRDQFEVVSRCVSSILEKTSYPNYEIVVLDNRSEDRETLDYLRAVEKHEAVRVIRYDHPFNFSAINNFGAQKASGSILGLVNNDIEVLSPDWLSEMVSHAIRPEIGCVGAKLYYPDDRIQHAGVILGIGGVAGHSHKYTHKSSPGYFSRLLLVQNLSAVTAACMVVRKSVFNQVGGLNESDLAIAFNDVDLCLRIRQAGYRNLWTPFAELIHHESISRGAEDSPEKIERFNRETEYMKTRWGQALLEDPYYSPNLTLAKEDFSLA
jgi:GT2 family glycosyltransferase